MGTPSAATLRSMIYPAGAAETLINIAVTRPVQMPRRGRKVTHREIINILCAGRVRTYGCRESVRASQLANHVS